MTESGFKHRVLLIEDDDKLAHLIDEYLRRYEFNVTIERRGDLALAALRQSQPALVVLDLMLPHLDGMEVCRRIRHESTVPILILTARLDVFEQIFGLESGADDYAIKPIEPRVLVARARALLRRTQLRAPASNGSTQALVFGALTISPVDRTVHWRGRPVELKTTEFDLLLILASAAGTCLSRDEILKQLRGIAFDGLDRSVDAGISRLRRHFQDTSDEPRKFKTIWGRGYLLSPSAWEE